MKRLLHLFVGLALALGAIAAHAERVFNQAELDALLAPIALYPDPLLANVLDASLYPQDVASAAAWSRANPQLQGDAALATVEGTPWPPSVKALAAYPDVLIRMAESPQWLSELGEAYAGIPDYVNATIQGLRARAQASGYLRSDGQQYVYQQGETIVVQPVYTNVVYAPYYDPYVVYGAWWWPAYRPVYWRPWVARPVIVTRVIQRVMPRPGRWAQVQATPWHPVPESQRRPIIPSAPALTNAPSGHWRAAPLVARAQATPVLRSAPVSSGWRSAPPMPAARVVQSAPMRSAPAAVSSAHWRAAPATQSHGARSDGNAYAQRGGGRHRD